MSLWRLRNGYIAWNADSLVQPTNIENHLIFLHWPIWLLAIANTHRSAAAQRPAIGWWAQRCKCTTIPWKFLWPPKLCIAWPWPQKLYGHVLSILVTAGASHVKSACRVAFLMDPQLKFHPPYFGKIKQTDWKVAQNVACTVSYPNPFISNSYKSQVISIHPTTNPGGNNNRKSKREKSASPASCA